MFDDVVSTQDLSEIRAELQRSAASSARKWSAILTLGAGVVLVCHGLIIYLTAGTPGMGWVIGLAVLSLASLLAMVAVSSGSRWSDARFVSRGAADLVQAPPEGPKAQLQQVSTLSAFWHSRKYFIGNGDKIDPEDQEDICLCAMGEDAPHEV